MTLKPAAVLVLLVLVEEIALFCLLKISQAEVNQLYKLRFLFSTSFNC